jgi:hypothetical protein
VTAVLWKFVLSFDMAAVAEEPADIREVSNLVQMWAINITN